MNVNKRSAGPAAAKTSGAARGAKSAITKEEIKYSDSKTTISELKAVMKNFVAEREWEKYHDPKNLSMSIAIEAAELMELFQWIKNEEAMAVNKIGRAHV